MKTLLPTTMLLAMLLLGCTIHEPSHQIIYTPDKPLTNSSAGYEVPSATPPSAALAASQLGVGQRAAR